MSSIRDRYLKTLRGPSPDAEALSSMERSLHALGQLPDLLEALRARLEAAETAGRAPIALILRRRVAEVLLLQSSGLAPGGEPPQGALEALAIYAGQVRDDEGTRRAAVEALRLAAQDDDTRKAVREHVRGEVLVEDLGRAVAGTADRALQAAWLHARARLHEDDGRREEAPHRKTGSFL